GAVGLFLWARAGKKTPASFETVKVDRGRIVARVTATGTLSALVTVQVGSQVSGRIQKLNVDFNSPVTKGMVLAKIDPQLFEASLEQARANRQVAQGNLARAQATLRETNRALEREKLLYERKMIALAELETAQGTLEADQASVAAAQ